MSYRSATGASTWCDWILQTVAPGALGPANGFIFLYSEEAPHDFTQNSCPSLNTVIGAVEVKLKLMSFHLLVVGVNHTFVCVPPDDGRVIAAGA
jgi:hypothetical protein